MPKELGYIGVRDIVTVVNVEGDGPTLYGAASCGTEYLGQVGQVIHNDGFGLCTVKFPNGNTKMFGNIRDLRYATKEEIEQAGIIEIDGFHIFPINP